MGRRMKVLVMLASIGATAAVVRKFRGGPAPAFGSGPAVSNGGPRTVRRWPPLKPLDTEKPDP